MCVYKIMAEKVTKITETKSPQVTRHFELRHRNQLNGFSRLIIDLPAM